MRDDRTLAFFKYQLTFRNRIRTLARNRTFIISYKNMEKARVDLIYVLFTYTVRH